jgi:hypothetical protein
MRPRLNRPSAPEERKSPLGRACNNRAIAHDHDRTLHQLRMFEQERDNRLGGDIVSRTQSELLETAILAHQLGRRGVNYSHHPFQRGAIQRMLQVLDSVELDAMRAQQIQRAA